MLSVDLLITLVEKYPTRYERTAPEDRDSDFAALEMSDRTFMQLNPHLPVSLSHSRANERSTALQR